MSAVSILHITCWKFETLEFNPTTTAVTFPFQVNQANMMIQATEFAKYLISNSTTCPSSPGYKFHLVSPSHQPP
jgi:hypothetical protein